MTEHIGDRLAPDELRTLFLFESLTEDQLRTIAEQGRVSRRPAGSVVYGEGEEATCFFVLLGGEVSLNRRVHGVDVEINRTGQRGVYAGATQAYLINPAGRTYTNTMRAITDCAFLELPADTFAAAVREWFPMAMHLLEGLFLGMRATQTAVGERERLVALGSLSAGLTHELNNPAAAAVRATSVLRDKVAGMRHKLSMIADGRFDGARLRALVELQEDAVKRAASATELTAMQASDAEDAVEEWLDDHGITGGWDIAPTLVGGGIDTGWLDRIADAVGEENQEAAVRWLAYTIETELLLREIDDSVARVSTLVAAAKQYSQLGRAPYQTVDVHDLLIATLTMLKGRIPKGVRGVKEFDRSLPPIPAYAAELNQVWTNLVDNALGAMGDTGTLTIRTGWENEHCLFVEIGDTGPGIPDEIRPRIFEPFFTTKPVGEGTGLGLDISYRIVVNKHGGSIKVDSRPGDTRFRVILPIDPARQPSPPAAPRATPIAGSEAGSAAEREFGAAAGGEVGADAE